MLSFFKKKDSSEINFKFTKFGSYEATRVRIVIDLPFQCLHFIYKLPLMILKAYWGVLYKKHPNWDSSLDSLIRLLSIMEDEQFAVDLITNITKEADKIDEFPTSLKED